MTDVPEEYLLYRRYSLKKFAIFLLIVLSIVAAKIVLIVHIETDSLELSSLRDVAYQIHARMVQKPALFVLFVFATIIVFIYLLINMISLRKSRLRLDTSGIRYESLQFSWLKGFDFSWTIDWADIDTIRVAPSFFDVIPCSTLTIDSGSQRRKISVYDWVDSEHRNDTLDRALYRRGEKLEVVRRALEQQSLIKYLRVLGIQVDVHMGRAMPGSGGFDLGSNRDAVFALLLLVALAIYAAVELVLMEPSTSLNMPLLGASVTAGILMAVMFTTWLRKASVPVLESVAIAMSLGVASGAVLYLALRNII